MGLERPKKALERPKMGHRRGTGMTQSPARGTQKGTLCTNQEKRRETSRETFSGPTEGHVGDILGLSGGAGPSQSLKKSVL